MITAWRSLSIGRKKHSLPIFAKMLMLEQYRDPKLAQLHHDYLAGGPLKYMAVIFRKLADSDETAMQLALEF